MSSENFTELKKIKYARAKTLAELLNIGVSTVWRYAQEGRIKPIKISSRVTVFDIDEVEKALLGSAV